MAAFFILKSEYRQIVTVDTAREPLIIRIEPNVGNLITARNRMDSMQNMKKTGTVE